MKRYVAIVAALFSLVTVAHARVKVIAEYEVGGHGQITLMNLGTAVASGVVNIQNGDKNWQEVINLNSCDMISYGKIDAAQGVSVEVITEGRVDTEMLPALTSGTNWRYRIAVDSSSEYNSTHWVEGIQDVPAFDFPCDSSLPTDNIAFGMVKGLFR